MKIQKAILTPPSAKRTLGRPAFPDKCVDLLKEHTRSLCTQTGKTHALRRSRQEPKNQNQTHVHESKQPHKPDEEPTEPPMTKVFSPVDQLGLVSGHGIPSQDGRNVSEETLKRCFGTGFSF
jgi:hypothetical protein